jgi:hypothetical protein
MFRGYRLLSSYGLDAEAWQQRLFAGVCRQYRLRQTEFTAQSALLELGTMYKVYLRDAKHVFKLSRVVALTKKQETILRTIDRKLLTTEN